MQTRNSQYGAAPSQGYLWENPACHYNEPNCNHELCQQKAERNALNKALQSTNVPVARKKRKQRVRIQSPGTEGYNPAGRIRSQSSSMQGQQKEARSTRTTFSPPEYTREDRLWERPHEHSPHRARESDLVICRFPTLILQFRRLEKLEERANSYP